MKTNYHVGRVWGIPVYLHLSLFLLMGYLALRSGITGFQDGGLPGGLIYVGFVLLFEAGIFASIALHELGHSYVAIRKGCRVREITLMFIGGAAKMDRMPRRPRDELLLAAAGPAVSILLGAAFIAISRLLPADPRHVLIWPRTLFLYLGIANGVLAGFNLIPAFPMDGGRLLRAGLTPHAGRLRATRMATQTGKIIAVLFVVVGLFGLPGVPWLESGNLILVVIAGFIMLNGSREYRMIQIEELMRKRGFDAEFTPGGAPMDDPDDDTVLISPPPFAKGPAHRAEIQRDPPPSSNPFDPDPHPPWP